MKSCGVALLIKQAAKMKKQQVQKHGVKTLA